jgi:hypothetical protein
MKSAEKFELYHSQTEMLALTIKLDTKEMLRCEYNNEIIYEKTRVSHYYICAPYVFQYNRNFDEGRESCMEAP